MQDFEKAADTGAWPRRARWGQAGPPSGRAAHRAGGMRAGPYSWAGFCQSESGGRAFQGAEV